MKKSTAIIFFLILCVATVLVAYDLVSVDIQQSDLRYIESERPVTGALWISPQGSWDEFVEEMSEVNYSLDAWLYQFTYPEALQLFTNLSQLGVDIRLIGENAPFGGSAQEFLKMESQLEGAGGEVISDEHLGVNFNHTKTFILDGERFVISTANLAYTSFRRNREYRFVGTHSGVVASLERIFEKDRAGLPLMSRDIDSHLLVCPIDCRSKLLEAIGDAESSVRIAAQYLQDEELVALLESLPERIDLKIIVGDNQDGGRLEQFGSDVKILGDPYLHAKNILIDGDILIMGSMNLSTNAMDNNREISVLVEDSDVIRKFYYQFLEDWEQADVQT